MCGIPRRLELAANERSAYEISRKRQRMVSIPVPTSLAKIVEVQIDCSRPR